MGLLEYIKGLTPNVKHRLELNGMNMLLDGAINTVEASNELKKWLGANDAVLNIRTIERPIHITDISRFKDKESFRQALSRRQNVVDYFKIEVLTEKGSI